MDATGLNELIEKGEIRREEYGLRQNMYRMSKSKLQFEL